MNKLYECCVHEQIQKCKAHFSKTAVICLNLVLASIYSIVFINICVYFCIFHFMLKLILVISLFCHFIFPNIYFSLTYFSTTV